MPNIRLLTERDLREAVKLDVDAVDCIESRVCDTCRGSCGDAADPVHGHP